MVVSHQELTRRADRLVRTFTVAGKKIVTAESCTGGLIVAYLTEIPGSSAVLERGYVTYSNEAKNEAIGVDTALIVQYGAVSEQVARAMALGALKHSRADIAVSVTGIAGPDGGTSVKPVGLVHFAVAKDGAEPVTRCLIFEKADRNEIRLRAVNVAFELLETALSS